VTVLQRCGLLVAGLAVLSSGCVEPPSDGTDPPAASASVGEAEPSMSPPGEIPTPTQSTREKPEAETPSSTPEALAPPPQTTPVATVAAAATPAQLTESEVTSMARAELTRIGQPLMGEFVMVMCHELHRGPLTSWACMFGRPESEFSYSWVLFWDGAAFAGTDTYSPHDSFVEFRDTRGAAEVALRYHPYSHFSDAGEPFDTWFVAVEGRVTSSPQIDEQLLNYLPSSHPPSLVATEVIRDVPKVTNQPPEVRGSCWTTSLAAQRPDAWRCSIEEGAVVPGVRGTLFDPCFEAADPTLLVCGIDPPTGEALLYLRVSAPVTNAPIGPRAPWFVELSDGRTCRPITGTVPVVVGEDIRYGCEGNGVVMTESFRVTRGGWIGTQLELRFGNVGERAEILSYRSVGIRRVWW